MFEYLCNVNKCFCFVLSHGANTSVFIHTCEVSKPNECGTKELHAKVKRGAVFCTCNFFLKAIQLFKCY